LGMGSETSWWGKASDQMKQLVAAYQGNPLYLSAYTQALLDRGALLEAERQIASLEKVEKERQACLGSAEVQGRGVEARGKGEQALAVLEAYASAPGAIPERALLCAGLQGRLGRVKEAVDRCEQARAKCTPEAVGGAGVSLLRAARSAPGFREDAWQQ